MAYQGPNNPSTFDQEGPGTSWTNASNVQVSDNVYATISLTDVTVSRKLRAMNYGFSIPTGATINGIEVYVERQAELASSITDQTVNLIKASVTEATDKADTVTYWANSDVQKIYGAPSDLWSTTWTPSDINNSGFGVAFRAQQLVSGSAIIAYVDWIGVIVYYTQNDFPGEGSILRSKESKLLRFGNRFLKWRM